MTRLAQLAGQVHVASAPPPINVQPFEAQAEKLRQMLNEREEAENEQLHRLYERAHALQRDIAVMRDRVNVLEKQQKKLKNR